jgi:hypothetical protein
MKFIFSLFVLSAIFTFNLSAQSERVIEWMSPQTHEFGDLIQDVAVTHSFVFKNITDEPITIENVRTTCGCTVPDWTYEPILPGATSEIKVEYDAHKLQGFRKRILVFFYDQKKGEKLYIEGYVEEVE